MSRASLLFVLWSTVTLVAQQPPIEFDVVSIKRNLNTDSGGGQTLPDGSTTMRNPPVRSIIQLVALEPVSDVVGLPEWARTERYDITAKAPAGATRAQQPAMMRTMLMDRFKVQAHVEQQQRDTFALVLARNDGRLGPQLKPSTLDCATPQPPKSAPLSPPSASEMQTRCGMSVGRGRMVSGGVTLDQIARALPTNGVRVFNRTGLSGYYSVTLTFSQSRGGGAQPSVDDAPEIFTALQEQLGLELVGEKSVVPVLVIDQIERPTPD